MKRTNKMTNGIFTILICLTVVVFTGQALGQGGTWETKANMPSARNGSAAGVINDIFYVAGGWSGSHLRNVEAYDPITDTWTIKNLRPSIQTGAAYGVVNGILYTAGGGNCCVAIASTWAYNPITDSWTQKASMSAPRRNGAGGVINGIFYFAGGLVAADAVVAATLEAYDPNTDSWTTLSPMPTPRFSSRAAGVINGILYVVGGRDFSGILATLEAYDPATDSWTTLSPMPTARFESVAGVINGILYVVGGRDTIDVSIPALATVEAYDPVTDTWSTMDPMPTARSAPVSAVINGQLYVAGGYDPVGVTATVSTLEVFTPCLFALVGDANDDCKVGLSDFAMMVANWLVDCGLTPGDPACIPK